MTRDATTFSALPVPDEYSYLDQGDLNTSVHDVSYLYAAYANDVLHGTSTAPDFRVHHLIDQITRTAEHFTARHDTGVIW